MGELRATSAIWSHDKTRIASILGSSLFISASDGTWTHKIATIPDGSQGLRWSPDKKTLRFYRTEYLNGDAHVSIWEVNVDGTSLHQFLPGWNTPPHECCGNWTPDGSFYIFESTHKGHIDLWAMPERETILGKRSSAPVRLSSGPLDLSNPIVSADGKRVFAIGAQQHGELVRYDSGPPRFLPALM